MFRPRLASIGSTALALAMLLDLFGVLWGQAALWRAGGWLAWPAFGLAALVWLARSIVHWGTRAGCRRLLAVPALALFAVARWVRGSAGVPPDWPILAASLLATVLYALALRPARRTPPAGRPASTPEP